MVFRMVALIMLLFTAGFGCRETGGTPPLSLQEFADIYVQSVLWHAAMDSVQAQAKVDSMLQSRGITVDQLEATVQLYKEDPKRWNTFLVLVEKKLEDATSVRIEALPEKSPGR